MHRARRSLWAAGIFSLLAAMLPFVAAAPVLADTGATVPAGFQDEVVLTGLDHPMSIVFAPNGNVFVAEKRGVIKFYTSLADTTPTVFADLNTNVHNYWDRGLMGLAVDPGYPTRPYVYVLYAYNHILGDDANAPPRWPSADAIGGSKYDDRCPNPPQGTADGCVISGRLSRLTASGGVMSGSEDVLVEDWCQQYPSHSLGSLVFGPEGALYASGGEGASFGEVADYGQLGGTLPGTPTPVNPCGDPGGANPSPPTAEGGALRSQDMRTSGDPVSLDGAVIRIDPDTGAAWPDQRTASARAMPTHGGSSPMACATPTGSRSTRTTGQVWIGDVGFNTWEELNRLTDPDAAPRNFGWPCYEGVGRPAGVRGSRPDDLQQPARLRRDAAVLRLQPQRGRSSRMTAAGPAARRSRVWPSCPTTSPYPAADHGALFMTDYTRRCIWELPAGSNGQPDVSARRLFANLRRPGSEPDGGSVYLAITPSGDLIYADYDRGEVRRIHYYGTNVPPVAELHGDAVVRAQPRFTSTSTPAAPRMPTTIRSRTPGTSTATASTTTPPGVTTSRTYSGGGDVEVGLQVSDGTSTRTTSRTVSVANDPPSVTIDTPDGRRSALERRRHDLVQCHRHRQRRTAPSRRRRTSGH